MGPLDKFILADDALSATENGLFLQFRSHWYRSLPLSCINPKISINGNEIDSKTITIEANGNKYALSEIENLDKEWLFITEAATLKIPNDKHKKGDSFEIDFTLDLYIPYVLVGPNTTPLLASSKVNKTLICQ